MFKKLLKLIQDGSEMSAETRKSFFEAVANTSENNIAAQVGKTAKETIMRWWYSMCNSK